MGVRGTRRGSAERQIHAQLKDATDALLAVVKILNDRPKACFGKDSLSLLAAAERRTKMIRDRVIALEASATKKEGNE